MLRERWRLIESLFHEALAKPPEDRAAFLDEACSSDDALRRELQSLLKHESLARSFLESDEHPAPQPAIPREPIPAGERIGPYTVLELLGAGGMGEVYKGYDARLGRHVALKFISHGRVHDAASLRRFEQEARAASALNHPNICTVYDVGEFSERPYLVMELLEGRSLKELIAEGPVNASRLASVGAQVCAALQAAHDKGIVHRDIKPGNIFVTNGGHVKVLDFGLAKRGPDGASPYAGPIDDAPAGPITVAGMILGTLAYMSPEQATGEDVDTRSDLFSLGVVLYEMATGHPPFRGRTSAGILGSILADLPAKPSAVNRRLPPKLDRVILKALEKTPARRHASAADLAADLAPWTPLARSYRFTWIAAAVAVLACGALFLFSGWGRERQRIADEVTRLTREGKFAAAFIEAQAGGSWITKEHWAAMSSVVSIETTPSGAEIRWKSYSTPQDPWQSLGRSPLTNVRVPIGALRVQVSKDGFETLERVLIKWNDDFHDRAGEVNLGQYGDRIRFELHRPGLIPADMVEVPAGPFGTPSTGFRPLPTDAYLIDKHEVTNRQYKEFVKRGGYQNRALWKHPVVINGRALNWEEGMSLFRDVTGMPGPATWAGGVYPAGQDEYPVRGVSWYEAAAYAEFAGKSLPTLHHWQKAALVWMGPLIVPFSHFRGSGPLPAGRTQALGPFGTYDMAGNVAEWCWNEATQGTRYLLGGAWNDEGSTTAFAKLNARPAVDRSATNGFRCVRYTQPLPDRYTTPHVQYTRDYAREKPVSDEIFEVYRSLYVYDRTALGSRVEAVEESSDLWRKEKVTFRTAYSNERMAAYLFLPKSAGPPYQTVVFMPWVTARYATSSANLVCMEWLDFVIKSGRAVLYPVYHGTYERQSPPPSSEIAYRDFIITMVKDLRRSIDYLETRPDIRKDQLGFYGASMGAQFGPYLALEERFKTAVLADGAFFNARLRPEAEQINFAPRVKIPVLMINGRYDWVHPVDRLQKPMFRWFGTPEKDKRHVLLDTTHYALGAREQAVREVLGWLDRYLGAVQ